MKEHALFLLAAFPAVEMEYRKQADWLREQFEEILEKAAALADKNVRNQVLDSGEIVTEFTETAERQTKRLTGIPIDLKITLAEKKLSAGEAHCGNRETAGRVRMLNRRILNLLNELISFKERILREVLACRLYTANYPLLIEHILRETRLYRQTVMELEQRGGMISRDIRDTELFWNQIMMEHALFIRGLLDPVECGLIDTANDFAGEYGRLLDMAKSQDARVMEVMTGKTLELTRRYRDFKAAGTEGITGCSVRSVILPLLADHVLREANHYLRLLDEKERSQGKHRFSDEKCQQADCSL